MNPSFSSPRTNQNGFTAPSPPFYHPANKDNNPPPFSVPSPKVSTGFSHPPAPSNSKSYQQKNNFEHKQPIGNNSAYLKSSMDSNSNGSAFQNFPSNHTKLGAEMTKSSFHDHPRMSEAPGNFPRERAPVATPPRRQPRFSEPGIMESPFEGQDPKGSFIPYNSKTLKEDPKEVHFYKKPLFNSSELQKPENTTKPLQKLPSFGNNFQARRSRPFKVSLQSFDIIRNLGKGKYGQVYLARQKQSGFTVALKAIEKKVLIQEEIVEQFIREIKIQTYLNHANIIKMYGFFDDKQNIYIILQLAMGGQLFQMLKRSEPMAETKAAGLMKQICTAVDELHSSRIIHRDIKPENIVLHEGVVKLCDFGWSVHLDNKMRTTFCGTPLYVCPQILKGNQYDEKIDIWSIGVLMYQMLVGQSPFKINSEEELIRIVKDEISIPSYVFVSRQARDFLDKCLQKNPNDRVTIKELANHPFFIKNAEKQKAEKKMVL